MKSIKTIEGVVLSQSVASSDVVEARRGYTHLGTYFSTKHFLANFLAILDHIWHLNFTDSFGGGLALDFNNGLQILFKPLLFLSH